MTTQRFAHQPAKRSTTSDTASAGFNSPIGRAAKRKGRAMRVIDDETMRRADIAVAQRRIRIRQLVDERGWTVREAHEALVTGRVE